MSEIETVELAPAESERFKRKRELILDAASELINQQGVKGLTLVGVAQAVNLNTTSVTYYFKRKEMLAAAAFERSIERMDTIVLDAASQPDPKSRVRRYLELTFDYRARLRRGEARPITVLSDLRVLDEPVRSELQRRYMDMFRKIRGFFGEEHNSRQKAVNIARAHVLTESLYWLPIWLRHYSEADFDRVQDRMFELFEKGFANPHAEWRPDHLKIDAADTCESTEAGLETFLRAATRLINERGYKGASVERIASELNVTKGSFYHHLNTKDDLVLECFDRSYGRVSRAQRLAIEMDGSWWHRLTSTISTLLDVQFEEPFPLLRTTALQALPIELRVDVVDRSNRMARRFAGMLIDGISDGSIRPIDPLIASQTIMAMLNAAFELRRWAEPQERADAIALYASTLAYGLFTDV